MARLDVMFGLGSKISVGMGLRVDVEDTVADSDMLSSDVFPWSNLPFSESGIHTQSIHEKVIKGMEYLCEVRIFPHLFKQPHPILFTKNSVMVRQIHVICGSGI